MSNRCPICYQKIKGKVFYAKMKHFPELRKITRLRFKPENYSAAICGDCYKEKKFNEGRNRENLKVSPNEFS